MASATGHRVVSAPLAPRERDQHFGQRYVAEPRRQRLATVGPGPAAARARYAAEPVTRKIGDDIGTAAWHRGIEGQRRAAESRGMARLSSLPSADHGLATYCQAFTSGTAHA